MILKNYIDMMSAGSIVGALYYKL